MFNIGDRVVCVNGDFSMYPNIYDLYRQLPRRDEVYTVRERQFLQGTGYRLLLEEIENPPVYIDMVKGMVEPGFDARRFALLNNPQQVHAGQAVEELEEALV
ncbi:MAG: hypothetical protein MUC97_10420 [Bernardetiaceae bacterium]|jgi:hypothetical protein|nr:hypothetical protein [Bernardetiaceae bacterium]